MPPRPTPGSPAWPNGPPATPSGTWPSSPSAATAGAPSAPTATSMWCSSTTGTGTSPRSPTPSGTRSGTRASTSTTPSAGPPRCSPRPPRTCGWRSACSTARLVWGESEVADPLLEKARAAWRDRLGARYLPLLKEQMAERRATAGDVAFLLEPDLKESHGGLRDVSVLRAISAFAPLLAEYADLSSVEGATALLTDIRVELHRLAQREHDKLLLQDQDQVAAALGFDDADALMLAVSTAGRQIAWVSDDVWRRRRLWDPSPAPKRRFRRSTPHQATRPGFGRSGARHGRGRRGDRPDSARPRLRRRLAAVAPGGDRRRVWTGPSPRARCTAWPTACRRRATRGRTRRAPPSSSCSGSAGPPSTRSSRSTSTACSSG